jgi:hypothetical protein
MQVPDEMRKCVVFLYCMVEGRERPAGTAFFVGWPIPDTDTATNLLLTAHHVIEGIRSFSDDGKVLLRLNTREEGAVWISTSVDSWYQPGPGLDCAVLDGEPDPELNVDYTGWLLRAPNEKQGPVSR